MRQLLRRRRSREAGAPSSKRPQALKRGHSPASIVHKPSLQPHISSRKGSPVCRRAFSVCSRTSETKPYGLAGMRNGGGPILKAPGPFTYWGAEEGALPREYRPRACYAELYREHRPRAGHAERGLRPQGAPAPQRGHSPASGNRCAVIGIRRTSPGSRAVPANATGDGA